MDAMSATGTLVVAVGDTVVPADAVQLETCVDAPARSVTTMVYFQGPVSPEPSHSAYVQFVSMRVPHGSEMSRTSALNGLGSTCDRVTWVPTA